MTRFAAFVLALSISGCYGGCGKKKESEGMEPPQAAEPVKTETPAKVTGEQIAKQLDACWDAWNQAAWDKFKACYTPDATLDSPGTGEPTSKGPDAIVASAKELKTGFPDMTAQTQLVLVHGHDVVLVVLMSGTHTGPFAGVKEMNQKVGFLMGDVLTVDDHGLIQHEAGYFDQATIMGQLTNDHPVREAEDKLASPKQVVVAKDDAAEQANIAVAKAALDAFDKHDPKAYGALLADDSVWSEQAETKDWNKAETIEDRQQGWKAFSDMKTVPTTMWAAGPYVVTIGTLDGTNDKPLPGMDKATKKHVSLPFLTIQQIENGKISRTSVFAQGMAFMQQLGLLPEPAKGSAK